MPVASDVPDRSEPTDELEAELRQSVLAALDWFREALDALTAGRRARAAGRSGRA